VGLGMHNALSSFVVLVLPLQTGVWHHRWALIIAVLPGSRNTFVVISRRSTQKQPRVEKMKGELISLM